MEDDDLKLSDSTLLALQQFLSEQKEQQEKFEKLKQISEKRFDDIQNEDGEIKEEEDIKITMEDFKEDWQLSQFWYDDDTQLKLIQEAIDASPENGWIACLCSPSVFVKYKSLRPVPKRNVVVFEFDERFNVYGPEFVFYDYKYPLKFTYLPEKESDKDKRTLKNKFDVVVMDPPFLSEECLVKASMTTRWILKENGKIIACTGRVQTELIKRLLNCKTTTFEPLHRGGLSNEFCCFSNYESNFLKWKDEKDI
ncbi:hypothetical protein H8356DRAFT_1287720 [Neocallimastix lanati (nom. inval.)]|jgi:hypothetical protein|nr:hypothetical protein H8356DRAFT_1287720 [Neocallimastix sp. JGI-2020a]